MSKKLTLNIEEELIQFAHTYSRQVGISISQIFEQYLKNLRETTTEQNLNPMIKVLYGSFKDKTIPPKKDLRKYFHEKSIIRP